MRALIFMVAAVVVLAAACSSDNSDGPTPDSSPSPEVPVGTTAEGPPEARDDLRQEIADTLEGFFEAFFNDEPLKLATYWSEECAQEDIDFINENLVFFADLIGGEAELSVDADALIIEELGDGRVRVPGADQPKGIYEILADGRPFPDPDVDAEEEDDDIVLVVEDGAWRVTGCDQFAADLELGS